MLQSFLLGNSGLVMCPQNIILMLVHGAKYFYEAFAHLSQGLYPKLSKQQIEAKSHRIFLPTCSIPVFHCLKFVDLLTGLTVDSVQAKPSRHDKY
jgi:bacteriorhodopsin